MATLMTLRWKLRDRRAPAASDRQDDLFNPTRVVKVCPTPSGPEKDDAEIRSRMLYNEGHPTVDEYYLTQEPSDVLALANA